MGSINERREEEKSSQDSSCNLSDEDSSEEVATDRNLMNMKDYSPQASDPTYRTRQYSQKFNLNVRSINLDDSLKHMQKLSDVSFPEIEQRGDANEEGRE